ncbi:peptidoglycan-N-acetylglucosamine deacetylase [Apiospora kogelbergensis]|uniref:Peptidoglycan-N-acetylglucosamine deacetylase n=1 Tax=Apiospora kogelbergensis TaxID=1337665 RepID=A0AAW0QC97_9PEZI
MHVPSILNTALFALCAAAATVPTPVEVLRRQHNAGTVITKCAKPGVLALAFDDGPYQYTSKLVDTLNNAGAKATFFFTGTLYGCIYNQRAAVKKAYDSGHQISSHTWTHANLANLGTSQIQSEMQKVEQAFVNIFGKKPAYMRPPNLGTSSNMLNVMRSMGYSVITDDIDTGDWNGQSPQQSQQKFQQAGAGGNGHIPLMHETYASTVDTLVPWLINWAKTNNLKLVTVAECLNDAGGMYQSGTFPSNGQSSC